MNLDWISVETKKPSLLYPVIASDGVKVKACYRTGDDSWSAFAPIDKVTHWMPYPNPPLDMNSGSK